MKRAIALVSGGMDSLVALAIACKNNEEVLALHVNYGHRTEKKEHECFKKITKFYKLKNVFVADIDYLKRIGGSSLTDLKIKPEEGIPGHSIPSSYVPFRNTHLLSIAVSLAEVNEVSEIYIGAVESDSSGYPDCREEYIKAFNNLIRSGSKISDKLMVVAPLIHKTKKEIVEEGMRLGVPFELSWSCYVKDEIACGSCQSCYLRLKGFREAGYKDPIKYGKDKV